MINDQILIAKKERRMRKMISFYLIRRGYNIIEAQNGKQAIKLIDFNHPQLILIDIELPDIDGYEICKIIRKNFDIPIILISHNRTLKDKLHGFRLGADDYVIKPLDFEELEARIKMNLIKHQKSKNNFEREILFFDNLKINVNSYECHLNNKLIRLSTKEMQLLILLAKRPSHVFSAEQIYDLIWGYDSTGQVNTVKVHIRILRNKIESNPSKPEYILTVRGFGYRFGKEQDLSKYN